MSKRICVNTNGRVDAARALLIALPLSMFAAACSDGEGYEEGASRALQLSSPQSTRILGFEDPVNDWSVIWGGSGTISSSTVSSEGSLSLAIDARNYVAIQSLPLSSLGSEIDSPVSYDVMLPTTQPNPYWFGQTLFFVNLPSANIYNAFIGSSEFTGLPLGVFNTVQFDLPEYIVTALRGTYDDLQLTIVLNVPYDATGSYRIDNLRFEGAESPVTRIGTDTFTNTGSQHATQVEPDSFSFGSTIVAGVQSGRIVNGGAAGIAYATSPNSGDDWETGNIPNLTVHNGGSFEGVTDPAVAYDAAHGVWLMNSIVFNNSNGAAEVVVNTAPDGVDWSDPFTVAVQPSGGFYDKNWIACDNTPTSPFFGHCYVVWQDIDLVTGSSPTFLSTSENGGGDWSTRTQTLEGTEGLGAQPVVQPDGRVVVVLPNGKPATELQSFISVDGGDTWSEAGSDPITVEFHEQVGLRSSTFVSVEIDGSGRIYAAWPDCSFRANCSANDIVMSTSDDGVEWSPVVRIPIDAMTSTVDHFIPGLGVDIDTSGNSAHLGLTYYYYPDASCTAATCDLFVGFVSSADGGASWSEPTTLGGPMDLSWLANTDKGRMAGDYISTSFAGGKAHPVFVLANAPMGDVFDEAMYTASLPIPTTPGVAVDTLLSSAPSMAVSARAFLTAPARAPAGLGSR